MKKDNDMDSLVLRDNEYKVGYPDPHDEGTIVQIQKCKNGYLITGAVYDDPMDYVNDPDNVREGYGYGVDFDGYLMGDDELEM